MYNCVYMKRVFMIVVLAVIVIMASVLSITQPVQAVPVVCGDGETKMAENSWATAHSTTVPYSTEEQKRAACANNCGYGSDNGGCTEKVNGDYCDTEYPANEYPLANNYCHEWQPVNGSTGNFFSRFHGCDYSAGGGSVNGLNKKEICENAQNHNITLTSATGSSTTTTSTPSDDINAEMNNIRLRSALAKNEYHYPPRKYCYGIQRTKMGGQ
jgi:hypothetical protein